MPDSAEAKKELQKGFFREWDLILPSVTGCRVISIYFGGGTPSLYPPEDIAALLDRIKREVLVTEDTEITLEANPESITYQRAREYFDAGINRASIGIQTLDANLLHILGREHGPYLALKAIEETYRGGIENISIDLMFDLPHQGMWEWKHTLEALKNVPISHLSLYNLTIEPNTLFFKRQKEIIPALPAEELSLAMLETAIVHLEAMGLKRYEISAFAKPGFQSRHNSGYWTGRPFLGLGPSAFSYWNGKRFRNVAHLSRYCKALEEGILPRDFEEELDDESKRRELFAVGIRLLEGIDRRDFEKRHGALAPSFDITLQRLVEEGFLRFSNGRVQLTQKGVLFYDTVATELI